MTAAAIPFGSRLAEAFDRSRLCIGIDPHPYLLDAWGLDRDARGLERFGRTVVEAAAGRVRLVKPQVAFFEALASAGFAALERVLSDARDAGLLVIGDAKRGDIGSTNDGYASAWLTPGSPLEVDALTVTAYTGVGALSGMIDTARAAGKGLFVLAATSNPESAPVQTAVTGSGDTVAHRIALGVSEHNADAARSGRLGSFGLVIGATKRLVDYGLDSAGGELDSTPVLAPGYGVQGARFDDIPSVFGRLAGNTVVSVSRSVLGAGPAGIGSAIESEVAAVAEATA
ncbi:orotidine-5'-phosphate decarboxylase [Cnuibacter physcomitrellae]|uniref:orotidine-5'-phosphate decarboxylase n=1 Tax=Cnuibacter physcomitrellae TaxID=1619308 RepID=UPI002175AD18|nr:orotidine-5'-phosphate decarboxylase [Cnuibacter physcomitrellae]MCS5496900.1 orotidine-5'-phosphate decarboxylase [Cnuibacter physcomitrellae]